MTETSQFTPSVSNVSNVAIAEMFGGFTQIADPRRAARPEWDRRVKESHQFLVDIRNGRRGLHEFREAMSTADFPLLFADSLDRQLYGAYMATTPTWQNYARAATVNDFRTVKRFATSGVRGLLKPVAELAEHERRGMDDAEFTYAVQKYEAGFALSFEAMINDDLSAFMRMPQDLADSARDSEEAFVTNLICDASGPNADNYTVGNDNILSGNPVLSRTNLQAAITVLMKRKDANGNPIQVKAIQLVVGTGLSLTANEIIHATEYRSVGANGDVTIISGNGVAANLTVNTNYWIDSIATSANADTSWWLFADPNGPRPALEFGRLRGYEAPALFEKIPDSRRIGGGAPEMFSFDTSASEKKIQHVFGGTFVDPKMTVASSGAGS